MNIEKSGWRMPRPAEPTWVDNDRLHTPCEFGAVEFVDMAGALTIAGGWAYLPSSDRPADAVLVTVGPSRRIGLVQPPLIGRGDIGDTFNSAGALVTGWTLESPRTAPGEAMEFWALDVSTLRAYPLCH
jgi:hypothetical protein